MQEDKKVGDIC